MRLRFWFVCAFVFGLLAGTPSNLHAQRADRKLAASGIRPYWIKKPMPHALHVYGEHVDSTEAKREAFYQARAMLIGRLLSQHMARMNDPALDSGMMQFNYRSYLLEQTQQQGWEGIQLMGMAIDEQRIRNRYFELRRDAKRGRSYYRYHLHLHWHDSLSQQLADAYFAHDRYFSDVIETAIYYIDKSPDLAMLHYQVARLAPLPVQLYDYRAAKADSLLQEYQAQFNSIELQAVNVGPSSFRLMLVLADLHLTGSVFDSSSLESCVRLKVLRENDEGFWLEYDESLCAAAADYPVALQVLLPDGSTRNLTLRLPGNRVVMRTLGTATVHFFESLGDGYLEMNMESISGQEYQIREVHLNGMRFNMVIQGKGRSIKGAGRYLLRAPINQAQMQQLLKLARQKTPKLTGGLVYSHPTSGVETDYCFENLGWEVKKHE